MSFSAKRKSIFTTDIPAGQYLFEISDAKTLKKSNGEPITHDGNPGLIITLKNSHDEKSEIHQEVFWIDGYNYNKLLKIMEIIGIDPTEEVQKKQLIGKQFWGEIVETKTMRGVTEVKSEKKIDRVWEKSKGYSGSPKEYIIYKEEKFHDDNQAF